MPNVEFTNEVHSQEETHTLTANVSGAEGVVGTLAEDREWGRKFTPISMTVVWKRTLEEPSWSLWRATLQGPRIGKQMGFWSYARYGKTSNTRLETDYITRAPQWLQDFVALKQPEAVRRIP